MQVGKNDKIKSNYIKNYAKVTIAKWDKKGNHVLFILRHFKYEGIQKVQSKKMDKS